jgi:hypothetical protein
LRRDRPADGIGQLTSQARRLYKARAPRTCAALDVLSRLA